MKRNLLRIFTMIIVFLLFNYLSMEGGHQTPDEYIEDITTYSPSSMGIWISNLFLVWIVDYFAYKKR